MSLRRFDEMLTTDETNSLLGEAAILLLDQLHDRAVAEDLIFAINTRDYRVLCDLLVDYDSVSVSDAIILRQVSAFFSKRVDLVFDDVSPDTRALEKFRESERLCAESNLLFMKWRQGGLLFPPDVDSVFYRAQRKIAALLGEVPNLASLKVRFGPGATTTLQKQEACARLKLGQVLSCSEALSGCLEEALDEIPFWAELSESDQGSVPVEIHRGRLSFVPKRYDVSRCVVVEPMLNTMFQLGIGDYIATRLKTVGIDLDRQEAKNKSLAREGSLTGALATLDLSSASDTISNGVVEHLLPPDWVSFLERYRTSEIELPGGECVTLAKFSSMGNGFTFPLETLIFYALAWSCCESDHKLVNCYGDDIIVPTHAVPLLERVLVCCGFILNRDKSFSAGPFRESCGGDYLKGIDIRPVYVKDRLSCHDVFRLHNFFHRQMQHDACRLFLEMISADVRIFGPDGYGDGHLLGDWVPEYIHKEKGWAGATFDTYRYQPRVTFKRTQVGDTLLPCYSIYASSDSDLSDSELAAFFRRWPRSHGVLRDSVPTTSRYRKIRNSLLEDEWKFAVTIPGTKGYARISIYVLNPRQA